MAKCVVHLKKIGGMGLGGVRNHMDRTGISRTNPDIDKERSSLNYSPGGFSDASHLEKRINERIKQLNLKKAVRRDAVRLVDIVITSSRAGMESMGEEGKKAFFKDAADFLARRYGRENIMYANVHVDESVDHMHIGFVPITRDGRLSAKSLLTRNSLKALQTDFWREVGQKHGLERGEPSITPKQHIETERHKAQEAEERATRAQTISDAHAADVELAMDHVRHVKKLQPQRVSPFLGIWGTPYYKVTPADYATLRTVAMGGAAALEQHMAMASAVRRAEKSATAALEGVKRAQSEQKAAEVRAAAKIRAAEELTGHVAQERDALRQAAAPYLDAPSAARPLADAALTWARRQFRAAWDTVTRYMARAVLRGEPPTAVAARYAQPMRELGMEEGDAMPRAAARAMQRQLRGHIPEDANQDTWITPPESVDYGAADASHDVLASVLSPAALHVMEENPQDGSASLGALRPLLRGTRTDDRSSYPR